LAKKRLPWGKDSGIIDCRKEENMPKIKEKAAAEYLGIPRTTLRTMRIVGEKRGKVPIPFYRFGVAAYYDKADLDAYLERSKVGAGE
jgi:hypothetical protein